MKKIIFCLAAITGFNFAHAQESADTAKSDVTYEQCISFRKTPPLRDIIAAAPAEIEEEIVIKSRRKNTANFDLTDWSPVNEPDGALQTEEPLYTKGGGMKANWQGQISSSYPPDPTGAAGPDHYVQALNSKYRVFDKDGSGIGGSLSLNSLWPGENGGGDPIVMYDRFADRWFISQFSDPSTSPDKIMIAISETADPTGAYYEYVFSFPEFPDYPKFGVWSNAYFMSANTGSNSDCVAFEREKMLIGDATAGKITMNFPNFYQFFKSIAPIYAEGPTLPAADAPYYFFAVQEDSWTGVTGDHIKILKCEVDWVTPSNSSVTNYDTLHTALFNANFSSGFGWEDIVQQGTTQKLDPVSGIFMYRAQYRRFPGYNVVMLCQSVMTSGNRSGIRWYELRENNDDGVWYIYQQGTYAPDTQNSRWMGSISMDAVGNIALAYCFSGPGDFPGIRYTGRMKNDPLGQMTVQEQIAVEGESAQTVTGRYGDYSQMTMDPADDLTYWFTGEYMGTGGAPKTRIFSFSSWSMLGQEENNLPPFFNAYQPSPEVVRVVWRDLADQEVTATVVDMSGRIVLSETLNTNDTQADFDVTQIASGIYAVTLTGKNTNLTQKIYLGQ